VLVLGVGILAASSAAILIRLAFASTGVANLGVSLLLAAGRLTFAALALAWGWPRWQRQGSDWRAIALAVGAGVALAVHFAAWISSLAYTSIAASTVLVTTNPLWVALLSWWWRGDRPRTAVWVGIGLAAVGAVMISSSSTSAPGSRPELGNLLALLGAWGVSVYLLLGQTAQQRDLPLGDYLRVAYTSAALTLLPLPPLLGTPYPGWPLAVYGWIALLGLIPQLIGHSCLNWGLRWLSPTLVALVILMEPLVAGLLGWVLLGEPLTGLTALGGGIILVGVAIAVWDMPPQ
jgi:drug/metabolite transporter (DMT)-like permease